MNSPLSPDWVPDRKILAETSDWVTGREPWPLRVAPLAGLVLLAALVYWTLVEQVDAPVAIAVSVMAEESASPGMKLLLTSPYQAGVTPIGRYAAVLRLQNNESGKVLRVRGWVNVVMPEKRSDTVLLEFAAPDRPAGGYRGGGLLFVMAQRVSLSDVLMRMVKR